MKKISGHTRPFAVLGHPIGHTLSPAMHNAAIEALGMDAIYLAFNVAPDRVLNALSAMADMGFGGVNLTVPLKEVAFRGLQNLDDSARILGAVNTVQFLPDGLKGWNTDGRGFLTALREAFGCTVAGQSVFILGSGGAGRAVGIACALENAGRIRMADVDPARPSRVVQELSVLAPGVPAEAVGTGREAWRAACRDADLVVQATPVGMKREEQSLLDSKAFREGQKVFDLIYMYPETVFLKEARQAGAATANGLGMLLHQGALAFSIWTGVQPPVEVMRRALEQAVYGPE